MVSKTILLVEDNPDDEALTLRALEKHNFAHTVEVVRDGAEALDYVFCKGEYEKRDKTQMPQLILLDIKLPKVDGVDRDNEVIVVQCRAVTEYKLVQLISVGL